MRTYCHVAPYSAVSNTKVACTPLHRGGCQRRIAKAGLRTGCVGGRLKTVCLVPEIEITRSWLGLEFTVPWVATYVVKK